MPRVHVEPAGFDLDVKPGENLLDAAMRQDARWPTVCFGQARCTACACIVLEGHENLSPIGPVERRTLKQITGRRKQWPTRDTRLGCQLTISGDITVEKKGAKTAEQVAEYAAARRG